MATRVMQLMVSPNPTYISLITLLLPLVASTNPFDHPFFKNTPTPSTPSFPSQGARDPFSDPFFAQQQPSFNGWASGIEVEANSRLASSRAAFSSPGFSLGPTGAFQSASLAQRSSQPAYQSPYAAQSPNTTFQQSTIQRQRQQAEEAERQRLLAKKKELETHQHAAAQEQSRIALQKQREEDNVRYGVLAKKRMAEEEQARKERAALEEEKKVEELKAKQDLESLVTDFHNKVHINAPRSTERTRALIDYQQKRQSYIDGMVAYRLDQERKKLNDKIITRISTFISRELPDPYSDRSSDYEVSEYIAEDQRSLRTRIDGLRSIVYQKMEPAKFEGLDSALEKAKIEQEIDLVLAAKLELATKAHTESKKAVEQTLDEILTKLQKKYREMHQRDNARYIGSSQQNLYNYNYYK